MYHNIIIDVETTSEVSINIACIILLWVCSENVYRLLFEYVCMNVSVPVM